MRSRSFARSSFGLSALGVNFFRCVNFFRFSMASPCGHCIAINPATWRVGKTSIQT